MRILILSILTVLFTINIQAQNTNVKSETKTTVKTVKNSDGEKKTVKKEEINEVQKVKLGEEKKNTLNIPMEPSPTNVTKRTEVIVDGVTQYIDVDRSAYYTLNGQNYQVALDKSGYTMAFPDGSDRAVLRRTSNNNYIFKNKDKFSVGYFDADGNLVVETYDEKTDSIVLDKYSVVKP